MIRDYRQGVTSGRTSWSLARVLRAGALAVMAMALVACGSTAPESASTPTPSITVSATPSLSPTATTAVDLSGYLTQKLIWTPCRRGLQCSTLSVPINYLDPSGGSISLALVKRVASGTRGRIGSLVVNPGGPGGSGVDYVINNPDLIGPDLRKVYDTVGFDPRGVNRSAPIRCLTPAQSDAFYAADGTPDSDAEATAVFLVGRKFAQSCQSAAPGYIGYLGTREAAQDLEILRSALGDKKLNYLGKSYGTFLGLQYANKFPSKVGRFVLDGVVDPSLNISEFTEGQARGFQRALDAFLVDCISRGCPLGGTKQRATARLILLLKQLDARPVQVGDRSLTEALATTGILASFYSQSSWPSLRAALRQVLRGDGSGLLALADLYTDRNPDGTYASNSLDAFYAISCMDRGDSRGVDATQADAQKLLATSKVFGPFFAWGDTPCQSWPVKATLEPQRITAEGTGPILVIGTTGDPATPVEWAQDVAGALADATLLTYRGDGHTAYGRGSSCIDTATELYLRTGATPADGTVCR